MITVATLGDNLMRQYPTAGKLRKKAKNKHSLGLVKPNVDLLKKNKGK